MQISDILNPKAVLMNMTAKSKKEAIKELVEPLAETGQVQDKKKMVQVLMEREELGSTGIGQGIAIPHGKSDVVKTLTAAFGLSPEGVPFDALDGEPVHLFFLLVAPEGGAGEHLKALARISSLLKDKYFRKSLMAAKSPEEVLKIIQEEEKLKH